jgi:micrococcal nuclease
MRKPSEFVAFPVSLAPLFGPYRAYCTNVVDGDTIDVMVDMGLNTYRYLTLRLRNVDAPELYRPKDAAERAAARAVKQQVETLVLNRPVLVYTHKDAQSFGRYVADVKFLSEGQVHDLSATVGRFMTQNGYQKTQVT